MHIQYQLPTTKSNKSVMQLAITHFMTHIERYISLRFLHIFSHFKCLKPLGKKCTTIYQNIPILLTENRSYATW